MPPVVATRLGDTEVSLNTPSGVLVLAPPDPVPEEGLDPAPEDGGVLLELPVPEEGGGELGVSPEDPELVDEEGGGVLVEPPEEGACGGGEVGLVGGLQPPEPVEDPLDPEPVPEDGGGELVEDPPVP
ncbi:hypothetical protein Acit_12545, partial [Aciditerrimonas ferrireducens]